jgi:riboflavin synthase
VSLDHYVYRPDLPQVNLRTSENRTFSADERAVSGKPDDSDEIEMLDQRLARIGAVVQDSWMDWVSLRDLKPLQAVRRRPRKPVRMEEFVMFTGLVEQSARVLQFQKQEKAWSLEVRAAEIAPKVTVGDSISVNGVCLTVATVAGRNLRFDVLEETRAVTNLSEAVPGTVVNLERSLKVGGRMGGHFVSGHVDGVGRVEIWEERGADWFLQIRPPAEFMRYVVYKGSIAINGISLTVAEVGPETFSVWIIPHTRTVTNLGEMKVGDKVNLEFDLLAKYAEKLLFAQREIERSPEPAS